MNPNKKIKGSNQRYRDEDTRSIKPRKGSKKIDNRKDRRGMDREIRRYL